MQSDKVKIIVYNLLCHVRVYTYDDESRQSMKIAFVKWCSYNQYYYTGKIAMNNGNAGFAKWLLICMKCARPAEWKI